MTCLEKAAAAVDGDRQDHYGSPADNHRACARLWEVYLSERQSANVLGRSDEIDEIDVCMMMILLKIARSIHGAVTEDTVVDIAGYARNIELLQEGR